MKCFGLTVLVVLLVAAVFPAGADDAATKDPRYTKDGQLIRPTNYREWIYLSSGLGMNYGASPRNENPNFDNVFVQPDAYRAFLATGRWPDKTIFVLEIRASEQHGSINRDGRFQTDLIALEAEVKDESRYPQKWAFFSFGQAASLLDSNKAFPASSACNQCHAKNAAVDNTFVQFYPTLLDVAKAKGTLR